MTDNANFAQTQFRINGIVMIVIIVAAILAWKKIHTKEAGLAEKIITYFIFDIPSIIWFSDTLYLPILPVIALISTIYTMACRGITNGLNNNCHPIYLLAAVGNTVLLYYPHC